LKKNVKNVLWAFFLIQDQGQGTLHTHANDAMVVAATTGLFGARSKFESTNVL